MGQLCAMIVLFYIDTKKLNFIDKIFLQFILHCRVIHPIRAIQWRPNECNGVSNHQHHDCLLSHLFSRISKTTSKLSITGLCEGNSLVTCEFPAQRASNAKDYSFCRRSMNWMSFSTINLEYILSFVNNNFVTCAPFIALVNTWKYWRFCTRLQ